MALRSRVWGAGKLLALLAAFAVTYLLFFALALRLANTAREVVVPSMTGQSVSEARTALSDHGLMLRVEETRRADAKIPAGRIAGQDPPAGRTTRRQRIVKVWLSNGPASAIVPDLVGESQRTAQARAQAAGLEAPSVAEIQSDLGPPDAVLAQVPSAGVRAGRVALLVNRSTETQLYVMPDLIGTSGARAAEVLRQLGFRVTVVGEHPYPGVAPGTVLRQQPLAGYRVTPGEAISLEVSR